MLGIHDYGVFVTTGVLLNLTPGQDTLYILGRSATHGRSIGIASALGISAGCLIHTLAAALGLSAILAAFPSAFIALKLVGGAYLIYLGIGLLFSRKAAPGCLDPPMKVRAAVAFRQGILTNVTNPKVALFFLAFMPQFIRPESANKVAAFLVLGLTFLTTGTLWCLILAVSAAYVRGRLVASSRTGAFLSRTTGALFIALGLRLAATRL